MSTEQEELIAFAVECESNAPQIFVRVGAKTVSLADLDAPERVRWIARWWGEGRRPVRVLASDGEKT